MSQDEFRGVNDSGGAEVNAVAELFTALLQTVDAFIGDLRSSYPGVFVLVLVLGTAVLAVAIWYGAKGASRRSYQSASITPDLPDELLADPKLLQRDAERLASEGVYLDAVRLAFRARIIEQALKEGSLKTLRGAADFRRARTYRELVDEFARSSHAQTEMRNIALCIEQGLYSRGIVDRDVWERVQKLRTS